MRGSRASVPMDAISDPINPTKEEYIRLAEEHAGLSCKQILQHIRKCATNKFLRRCIQALIKTDLKLWTDRMAEFFENLMALTGDDLALAATLLLFAVERVGRPQNGILIAGDFKHAVFAFIYGTGNIDGKKPLSNAYQALYGDFRLQYQAGHPDNPLPRRHPDIVQLAAQVNDPDRERDLNIINEARAQVKAEALKQGEAHADADADGDGDGDTKMGDDAPSFEAAAAAEFQPAPAKGSHDHETSIPTPASSPPKTVAADGVGSQHNSLDDETAGQVPGHDGVAPHSSTAHPVAFSPSHTPSHLSVGHRHKIDSYPLSNTVLGPGEVQHSFRESEPTLQASDSNDVTPISSPSHPPAVSHWYNPASHSGHSSFEHLTPDDPPSTPNTSESFSLAGNKRGRGVHEDEDQNSGVGDPEMAESRAKHARCADDDDDMTDD